LPVDKVANRQELERLGLAVMTLDTRSLDGYLATVPELGRATGHVPEALEITSALERAIGEARARAEGRPRPRVLFSVMRSYQGLGSLTEITAVGGDGFFSQMLSIAGGENVYQGPLSFPKLSREAIMTLNPAIVVDLVQGLADAGPARADWDSLGGSVAAVRDGRVHLFTDESDTVPGPRIHRTITKLSEAFFPEGDPPQAGPPQADPANADPAPAAGSDSAPPDPASPAPAAPAGAPLREGLHG
jgi:iron complex transport system substrate-binding protein